MNHGMPGLFMICVDKNIAVSESQRWISVDITFQIDSDIHAPYKELDNAVGSLIYNHLVRMTQHYTLKWIRWIRWQKYVHF